MMNTNKMARTLMTLSAAALALLPAVAGAQSGAVPNPPALTAPQSAAPITAQPITISYYAGNPAQGGKLLSKVTLTRPERGPAGMHPGSEPMKGKPGMAGEPRGPQGMQGQPPQAGQPQAGQLPRGPQGQGAHHHGRGHHNPLLSHAPKGATFAIIKGEHGSHILDLTKPMPRPQGQEAQPGQPVPPQQ